MSWIAMFFVTLVMYAASAAVAGAWLAIVVIVFERLT